MGKRRTDPTAARASALADFLRQNVDAITSDWLVLARELPSARKLDREALLDFVPAILENIADLAEALGRGLAKPDPSELAATHAQERLESGFELDEIVQELSMLRACVFARLDGAAIAPPDVVLLSRAIDAAVAAAVHRYTTVRDRWLQGLDRIGSATLESRSLEELLQRMLRIFVESTPSLDTAAIFLREGDRLHIRATVGLEEELRDQLSLAIGEGFVGTIAESRAPLALRDARTDPLVKSQVLRDLGIRALFGVPLVEDGQLLGVAHVGSRHTGELSSYDRRLFTAMASRATTGIVHFLHRESRSADEARLREAEERFRLIVEQVHDHSIVMLDPDGRIASWSEAARRITGWSADEVAGEPFAIGYPDEDRREGKPERLLAAASAHGFVEDEGWRVRRDGSCFWANVTLTKLTDPAGRVRGFAEVARDLTERRRSEGRHRFLAHASRRLSESLELDATLASLAHLCIEKLSDWCAIDLVLEDGSLRRVAVEHRDASKRALAAELGTRYPAERGIRAGGPLHVARTGRSVLVTHVTEDLLRRAARDEEHLRILRGLGLRSYVCVPMTAGGRVVGVITLGSDDPRRLHDALDLEVAEELAQRAALAVENARLYRQSRESIEQRDELLAVVSHDLRNPLNVVHMGATLLAEGNGAALGSIRDQAQRILRAAHRMERLIQDLLDVASLERGQLALVRRPEAPEPLLDEACETFRGQMRARGVELRVDSSLRRPLEIDRDRVMQVLGNLLSNALRLTPSGGSVTVRAEEQGDHALFCVADTGPGIPADEQVHLFRRHWRGRAAGYRGTGRGLAIAKGIVEAHGGRIWFESAEGAGTSFFFTLPLAPT